MARPVSLAELVATLSLVSDLGMGHPMERALRQTVISLRLAQAAGLEDDVRSAAYYTSLLSWVGCAADTSDLAGLFGDEIALYADTHDKDLHDASMALFVMQHLGNGESRLRRIGLVGTFLATAGRSVQKVMQSHCQAASDLADQLDLGAGVSAPLLQAFERWDGRGVPGTAGKEDLSPAIRLVHVADSVEYFSRDGGAGTALKVLQERRGTQFDPTLVDCFTTHADAVLGDLGQIGCWDEVIALDPALGAPLHPDQLDQVLAAFADFADLKTPIRTGHSRAVADLAARAAAQAGLSGEDQQLVRRAGLVHDIGMIGVPSSVWESTQPWTQAQRERAHTHPYLTQRMLARVPALADVARCAAMHHERLDGSGYPNGLSGDAIPFTARVLAAADVYQALMGDRLTRPAMSAEEANRTIRDEVRDGRLDGRAVDAVLAASGQRVRGRSPLPAGLTPREAEVLVLLARGLSNKQIAAALTLSGKTISTHLEHVFTKVGVTTRTQAALFAMQNGLAG